MHRGWINLLAGVAVIGLGLFTGGSIFLGNPSGIDYFFDILGIILIGMGIYQLMNKRESE